VKAFVWNRTIIKPAEDKTVWSKVKEAPISEIQTELEDMFEVKSKIGTAVENEITVQV